MSVELRPDATHLAPTSEFNYPKEDLALATRSRVLSAMPCLDCTLYRLIQVIERIKGFFHWVPNVPRDLVFVSTDNHQENPPEHWLRSLEIIENLALKTLAQYRKHPLQYAVAFGHHGFSTTYDGGDWSDFKEDLWWFYWKPFVKEIFERKVKTIETKNPPLLDEIRRESVKKQAALLAQLVTENIDEQFQRGMLALTFERVQAYEKHSKEAQTLRERAIKDLGEIVKAFAEKYEKIAPKTTSMIGKVYEQAQSECEFRGRIAP